MAIKKISTGAYFVVDTFSYRSRIQEYDPLATNQTLIAFDDDFDGGLAVLHEGMLKDPDDLSDELSEIPGLADKEEGKEEAEARAELKRITPPNARLLKLVERFPAPQEWYDE